jgi:putative FmdB family regulatory protein
MPTYDYACTACGHAFELFQGITEPVKRTCPRCRKPKLQRLIGTGAGIIFRGGGFYETDYRSDSYKKGAEAESKANEPKADSKPAEPARVPDSAAPAEAPGAAADPKPPTRARPQRRGGGSGGSGGPRNKRARRS